ncbi:hypothetical protein RhiirC2_755280, partial [Rhizophagus irregularis]
NMIHTNDYHINTSPIRYKSTSRLPNIKFQISKMFTHFFPFKSVHDEYKVNITT